MVLIEILAAGAGSLSTAIIAFYEHRKFKLNEVQALRAEATRVLGHSKAQIEWILGTPSPHFSEMMQPNSLEQLSHLLNELDELARLYRRPIWVLALRGEQFSQLREVVVRASPVIAALRVGRDMPAPVRKNAFRHLRRLFNVPACGFRRKSATHSDLKSATDSNLKPATCSDPSRPPIPI